MPFDEKENYKRVSLARESLIVCGKHYEANLLGQVMKDMEEDYNDRTDENIWE